MLGQGMLPRLRESLPGRLLESRWFIPAALMAVGSVVFGIDTVSTSINPQLHWLIDLLAFTLVLPLLFGWLLRHLLLEIRRVQADHAVEVQETRRAISRELHDSVAQRLCYLHLRLDQLVQDPQVAELTPVRAQLDELRQATDEAYEELYSLLTALRPVPISDLGAALRARATQAERRSGVSVSVVEQGGAFDVPQSSLVEIVRIVSEALSNIEKHARADAASIGLDWGRDALDVSVTDNGHGFAPEQTNASGHFGLKIMRERAARVQAILRISSAPEAGTSILLTVPRPELATGGRAPGGCAPVPGR